MTPALHRQPFRVVGVVSTFRGPTHALANPAQDPEVIDAYVACTERATARARRVLDTAPLVASLGSSAAVLITSRLVGRLAAPWSALVITAVVLVACEVIKRVKGARTTLDLRYVRPWVSPSRALLVPLHGCPEHHALWELADVDEEAAGLAEGADLPPALAAARRRRIAALEERRQTLRDLVDDLAFEDSI